MKNLRGRRKARIDALVRIAMADGSDRLLAEFHGSLADVRKWLAWIINDPKLDRFVQKGENNGNPQISVPGPRGHSKR